MSILGCAGSDEPGANYTPPTLSQFMKNQVDNNRRLREASAGRQVIQEARAFHLKQATKYGTHTGRGLAHFRASKMYTREGGRLQEMFDQGGQDGELPPKAIMKANKAAMMFHKKQADKAGLDSDLGHAHVAAMEHHQDIFNKAKQMHKQAKSQQQPGMESAEGGPGSGPHKGGGSHSEISNLQKRINHHVNLANNSNDGRTQAKHDTIAEKLSLKLKRLGGKVPKGVDLSGHEEALPGHGSKQSPVPVPKKSEQPNNDIRDPNKPPVQLSPEDANKQPRRLQQNESAEGGPGSGRHKGGGTIRITNPNKMAEHHYAKAKEYEQKRDSAFSQSAQDRYNDKANEHYAKAYRAEHYGKSDESRRRPSLEARMRNFGRESNAQSRVEMGLGHGYPKGVGRQVEPDLVTRQPRTKESLRRRHL